MNMKNYLKTVLFFLCLMAFSSKANAQESEMAILKHNGEVSYFYGASSFSEAYQACVSGDEIILSAGRFDSENTFTDSNQEKKNLIIRGAGADPNGKELTMIYSSNSSISINGSTLTIEGIWFTKEVYSYVENSNISKCRFTCYLAYGTNPDNCFINCLFDDLFEAEKDGKFYNCIINSADIQNNPASFFNCIFVGNDDTYLSNAGNVFYENCIFATARISGSYYTPFNNSQCRNCMMIFSSDSERPEEYNPFEASLSNTNRTIRGDFSTIFKTFDGTYNVEERYELNDDAKSKYKGTDETEIGINGGSFPFSMTVSSSHILSKKIDTVTKNGKLHVNIKLGFDDAPQSK